MDVFFLSLGNIAYFTYAAPLYLCAYSTCTCIVMLKRTAHSPDYLKRNFGVVPPRLHRNTDTAALLGATLGYIAISYNTLSLMCASGDVEHETCRARLVMDRRPPRSVTARMPLQDASPAFCPHITALHYSAQLCIMRTDYAATRP